jgi:hypothetical protein
MARVIATWLPRCPFCHHRNHDPPHFVRAARLTVIDPNTE